MIEQDTIRLLRECDAGIQMGVSAIDEVGGHVESKRLKECLETCRAGHEKLQQRARHLLDEYHDSGKAPNPMAKGMSWMKTNVRLGLEDTDQTVASLMTDGCNMGVKSLNRYLNEYAAADERSKALTKDLIRLESDTAEQLRAFL